MDGTENEENKAPEAGETQPEVVPETDTAVAPPLGEATPAEPATETAPEPTEEAPADNANLAVGDKDGQADENKDGDDESSRQKEGVKEETKIVAEDGEKKEETDKEETADADNKTVESVQEVSDEKEKEEGGGDDGGVKETSESKEEEKKGKEGEGGEEEEKKSEEVEGEKKKEEDEVQAADQDNQGEVSPPIVEKTDDKKEDDADKPSSDETKKEGEAEPAAEPATEPVVAEGEGQPEAAAEGQTAQEEEPKTEAPKAEEDAEKKSDETDAAAAEEKPAEESQPKEEVKEGEEGEKVEAKPEEGEKVEAKPEEGEKVEAKPEEGEKVEAKPEEGEKVEATPEEGEKGDEKEEKKEGDEKKDDEGENATVEKAATDEDKVDGEEKKDEEKEEGGDDAEEKKEEGEAEEEGEGVDGEKKEEEDEDLLDPDFYYEFEEHVSKAVVAQDSGLPLDMLALQHSYGYDCKRRNNLLLMDEKTVVFAAGNLIQILDLVSKEQKYLRSTSGCGIGAIAVHPSRKYFAVGEKGETPNINIFEFPSLKLYRILRGGTESSYTSLTYSPDGELLASQGGEPDFMLTLWNWRQEKTTLRTKSFSQDVFKVSFAPELEGQLTTAGSGHIRFWKMADTFTGLKLQGELGRFGRTEISDIEGYVELPDGKVLSGAEWGNLLLWEGGLIKVEITRKGKKSCHKGPIMQILLDEGELMTVGMDGYIRVWDFESIDTADSSDDSGRFEMDPMNELSVASNVQLNTIVKSVDEEKEPTIWYSQDANGGIWKLDLSFSHTSQAPEKMFTYHSGRISGCVTSPLSHIAVTAGIDSTVRVYDYMQQKQLTEAKFSAGSTCILWAPLLLDPKASTVVTGYNDGVVRILSINQLDDDLARKADKQDVEIALKQTFKPHKAMVTAMAFDGKGEMLATGSSDGTVFFLFASVSNFEPIGFVQVSSAVRQLVWTPEKFKHTGLMVVCEDGQVLEIEAPEPGNFDTSHSFEINGLPMKSYQFKSIKSHLRHEEELERLRIEEEERKRKEEEERKKRIERGLETESEQGDEEVAALKPKSAQKEWTPYIPTDPSPILYASYSKEEGTFWLSMGDFDAGYLYECKFTSPEDKATMMPDNIDKPLRAIPVLESSDVPIHVINYSHNGQQVIFGMENGQIRIQQLDEPNDISMLGPQFTLNMHDNNYGHVTATVLSYDNKTLLSTGADGNLFQFSYMDQEKLDSEIKTNKAKLPSARKAEDKEKVVDDIDDPNAYSIEDAKQKTERDKMMKRAEEKKKDVRKKINHLRRQFRSIIEQNETIPKHLQLSRMEFEMDREIKNELQRHTQEKKDLVKKELAWESEKLRISLEKLRKRFKDLVECERIVVKAFGTTHEVASFRASKLSEDFYSLKADFERKKTKMMTKDEFSRDPTRDMIGGQKKSADASGGDGEGVDGGPGSKVTTNLKGSMGERINNALQKVEEKKKKRAARKALWEDLYGNKPDDDYEDPHDVAAIKEAQENMGDYKLKTALDYVVPDHLRMNVDKARGRLLAIKDMIHEYKYAFNVKLLSLRDKKIKVIDNIRDIVTELRGIHQKLEPGKQLAIPAIPEMHPDEMPEKLVEYTRDSLKAFKIEYEVKLKQQKTGGGSGGDGGGFGFGFGGGGGDGGGGGAKEKQPPSVSPVPSKQPTGVSKGEKTQVEGGEGEEGERGLQDTPVDDSMSPLEREIYNIEQIKLAYDQSRLLSDISEMIKKFDAELRLLRHDKFRMDIVMKDADLRQVTLFEELVLLKEYEKREDTLAEKVGNKQQEKGDMQLKILEVQGKIDSKKKDIEKLQEKERTLMQSFATSLGENNKFADYLTKVFKKRVKRTKKKDTEGDGSDDDSDDDSSDDSDWEESDEESESEMGGYDLDVCPPGCDQKLYDDTCTMREKRLDIEEALAEEKKNQDGQKKELESLQKKAKVIESQLKTAQNDLEDFQLEKQQKLNELIVVATLKLHQIHHIANGTLSHDLNPTLVFESDGVVRLAHRIKELEHEKLLQKRHMRESKRKHVQLIKDRRVFEAEIQVKEEKCEAMMVAKFGLVVDLEQIETVTVNRAIEELKEKLRQTEYQCSMEIRAYDDEIASRKNRITDMVRDNTQRLTQLAMLLTEQNMYTNSLDNRQKRVGAEFKGQRKTDVREKQRLIQLVQLQAQEIDALKEEIMLLSRKGGHILPPAQPPLTQSPSNFAPPNL